MGFDAFLGSGLYGSAAAASQGTTSFADDVFRVTDDGEVTAKIAFQASAISSGTTRTILMPDADVDLGSLGGGGGDSGTNHTESAGPPLATWDSDNATGDLVAHTVGDTHYDTATQLVYTCEDATATAAVWYAKSRRVVNYFSCTGKLTNVMTQSLAGVFTVPGVISKIVFNTGIFTAQDASNYWEFDYSLNNNTSNFILSAPKDMNSSQNINSNGSYDMGAMTATTAYKTVAVGDSLRVHWQAGAGTPASLGNTLQGYTVWVDTAIV